MEIKYFKLIKTITEEGTIASSSKKLFLTQSALSHQLKELENQLGFKVFYRKPKQWQLTQEGKELYSLGNEILERLDKGLDNIKQLKEGTKGIIRISTECYSFYHGLPKLIQKTGILYPNITIELNLEATHKPLVKILNNEIDIAITTVPSDNPLLSNINIYEDEIYALMHQENIIAKQKHIIANDFIDQHLIIHSYPLETVSIFEHFFKPNKISPKKVTAIPLTEIALEMVSANMGIICMPKWALTSFKLPNEIILKRINKTGIKRTHYLIIRKTDSHKKYIQDFTASVKEHFTEYVSI